MVDLKETPELKPVMELYDYLNTFIPKIKRVLDVEKFKKAYDPKDTNLQEAMMSAVEICFSGYYLALRDAEYRKFIYQTVLGKEE